jgi:chromosomal replication initiation ATPase DnaA
VQALSRKGTKICQGRKAAFRRLTSWIILGIAAICRKNSQTTFTIKNCDMQSFVQTERVKGVDKEKRDLLIYLLWNAGGLSNAQIGHLFGISYSAVSHAVRSIKRKMQQDGNIMAKFKQLNSQFKL